MRQDLMLSFLLHFLVVIAMIVTAPFKPQVRTDIGDVIKVNLATLPQVKDKLITKPVTTIPKQIVADEAPVPITEVASITEAKPIKEQKPKPKETKDDTYKPQAEKGPENKPGIPEAKTDITENLGAGSKFGGASVDNESFDYPYWFTQAFSKIERNWRNPIFSNRSLSCIIYFQVIRSGRIIKTEIEKSSGVDAFDGGCERAIYLSQPLPPLPNQFTEEIIGIHLEFPYEPGL